VTAYLPRFTILSLNDRVTLSYNLFFEETSVYSTLGGDAVQERAVERIVNALNLEGNFDDSQPFIAFHLQHAYVSLP